MFSSLMLHDNLSTHDDFGEKTFLDVYSQLSLITRLKAQPMHEILLFFS